MITLKLWGRFATATRVRASDLLSAIAFACAVGALLTVLGGVLAFRQRMVAAVDPTGWNEGLFTLSLLAAALLLPAVWTLAQAAVRLAVARRDARLAVVRLVGATRTQVKVLAILDALAQTLVGAFAGVALYFALIPLVSLLRFGGTAFAPGELVLPIGIIAAAVGSVLLIALASCLLSLRRVSISPLGVAAQVRPKRLGWWRVAAWAVGIGAYGVLVGGGVIPRSVTFVAPLVAIAVLAVLLIGPLVLWLVANVVGALARSPYTLVAARRLAQDPRGAFNVVGAMSIAIMVGGFASLVPAMSSSNDTQAADLATGALLTIGIAALLGAVLAGVSQSAKVLDQTQEHRALYLMGMSIGEMRRTLVRGAWIPLIAMVGSAFASVMVLLLPFMQMWLQNPGSVLLWIGMCVAACACVLAATAAATPLVRRVATSA